MRMSLTTRVENSGEAGFIASCDQSNKTDLKVGTL